VHVEDCLAGGGAGVEDKTEVAVGEPLGHAHELGEKSGVTSRELDDVGVLGGLGNNEDMDGSLRVDVAERDDRLRLEHDVRGDLTRNDALEDCRTVTGHASIVERAPVKALSAASIRPYCWPHSATSERVLMDDVLAFFIFLSAVIAAFAALAVAAAVRARRNKERRWWALPAVSIVVGAAPILVAVSALLIVPVV